MSFPPGGGEAKDVARWKSFCKVPLVSPFATLSNCLPLHLHTMQQMPYQHVHTHTHQALQLDLTRRIAKTNRKKKQNAVQK